ncbi:MAG: hypothetical protein V8R91_21605 [Butyricimonas faecihominis]
MALYAEAAVYSDNVDMIDREEILEKIRKYWTSYREKCREVCLLAFRAWIQVLRDFRTVGDE